MNELGPGVREKLTELQQELAEVDAEILKLDLDDPDTTLTILLMAAIFKGGSIGFSSERQDGEKESIRIESLGTDFGGAPITSVFVESPDGTLGPNTSEIVAGFMSLNLEEDIQDLLG